MFDDEHWQAGLRALLEDILEDTDAPPDDCVAMRQNLDLYVNDELEGQDARGRQPALWAHLQSCTACRAQHDMLLALLTAEARAELTPLPSPSSAAAVDAPPWRVVIEPRAAERPALLFVFLPTYLRDGLRRGRSAEGARAAQASPDTLLLSYLGETPAGEAMVQLSARPVAGAPAQYMLTVIAAAEPMPRTAVLTWGGQTLETVLGEDGVGQLGPVARAALDGAEADAFTLRIA